MIFHHLSSLQLLSGANLLLGLLKRHLLSAPEALPLWYSQPPFYLSLSEWVSAIPNSRDPLRHCLLPSPPVSSSCENTCYQARVNPCFLPSHNISFSFQPHFRPSCFSLDKPLHLILELLKTLLGQKYPQTSLVVQWLRNRLQSAGVTGLMPGSRRSPTWCEATKPLCATTMSLCSTAWEPQALKPTHPGACALQQEVSAMRSPSTSMKSSP